MWIGEGRAVMNGDMVCSVLHRCLLIVRHNVFDIYYSTLRGIDELT